MSSVARAAGAELAPDGASIGYEQAFPLPKPTRSRRRRGSVVRRKLLVADLAGLISAYGLLLLLLGTSSSPGPDPIAVNGEAVLFVASLPVWIILARAIGLYNRDEERPEHSTTDDVVGVFQLVTVSVWLTFVASWLTRLANPDVGKWILFWLFAIVFIVAARATARFVAQRSPDFVQRAVIVGTDRTGQLIGRKLSQHAEYHIELVGFVDAAPRKLRADLAHVPVLGPADSLLEQVDRLDVDRVVVSFSGTTDRELMTIARDLQLRGVQVDIVPRLFEALGENASLHSLEGIQLVSLPPIRMSRDALLLKRAFDIFVSSLLLLLTWPLLVAIAVWIRLDSPGPVLFRQTRLGLDQRPFVALKFRTMMQDTSQDEHRNYIRRAMDIEAIPERGGLYKLERTEAITRAGRWLRKTSLDELPQLFNVLRGEMSLVGPRPCIPYETEQFQPHHFERFTVPAGLTGLWQVKARGHSTFVEALDMDVAYSRSWSFWRDIVLLLETPVQVLRPKATR